MPDQFIRQALFKDPKAPSLFRPRHFVLVLESEYPFAHGIARGGGEHEYEYEHEQEQEPESSLVIVLRPSSSSSSSKASTRSRAGLLAVGESMSKSKNPKARSFRPSSSTFRKRLVVFNPLFPPHTRPARRGTERSQREHFHLQ